MSLEPIWGIAATCAKQGIRHAVLSPGSRCAPLTLAFSRRPEITCHVVPDERSAAYIALGMAQQSDSMVALICTSGTAALNYAPALAEAFYLGVPLLVLTADRPAELIDRREGQTIHQSGVYGPHVKGSSVWPDLSGGDSVAVQAALFDVAGLISVGQALPGGPVHVNVPLAEPLYPQGEVVFSGSIPVVEPRKDADLSHAKMDGYAGRWLDAAHVFVLVGQFDYDDDLRSKLAALSHQEGVTIVGDLLANTHGVPRCTNMIEAILSSCPNAWSDNKPDLLITLGKSLLSKRLRTSIAMDPPSEHWHVEEGEDVFDTLGSITARISSSPDSFLEVLPVRPVTETACRWESLERDARVRMDCFFDDQEFGEMECVSGLLAVLPEGAHLHLASSMSVRYASMVLPPLGSVAVWSNRGTAGIDGCLASAVGHAMVSTASHFLLIGDVALQYGRNALWQSAVPDNLHIVVLNNGGGGIFSLIDGPSSQPECEAFFIAEQSITAESVARDFGFQYISCTTRQQVADGLKDLCCQSAEATVLEIHTSRETNRDVYQLFTKGS